MHGYVPACADDEHPERGEHADNNVDIQEFAFGPSPRVISARRCAWAPRFFIT